MPSQIPEELVKEGVFIFLGGKQLLENLDYEEILSTLDRLLPLYIFTEEGNSSKYLPFKELEKGFLFKSGCTKKLSSTGASLIERKINIKLKHNDMQQKLYDILSEKYGKDSVGTEVSVNSSSIDLVVKNEDEYWFYEIKTAPTAKSCIRQALGQILEYSYYLNSSHQKASKLIVVGMTEASDSEKEYINILKTELSLPLEYTVINA